MKIEKERIGNIVKEKYGIIERRYCSKCGKNLPLFVWECPYCIQYEVKDKNE